MKYTFTLEVDIPDSNFREFPDDEANENIRVSMGEDAAYILHQAITMELGMMEGLVVEGVGVRFVG